MDVWGHKNNAVAYADDIVLFPSTRMGLTHILDGFIERAEAVGLTLRVRKCATAGLKWLGRSKKIVADNVPFRVGQEEIPEINI